MRRIRKTDTAPEMMVRRLPGGFRDWLSLYAEQAPEFIENIYGCKSSV